MIFRTAATGGPSTKRLRGTLSGREFTSRLINALDAEAIPGLSAMTDAERPFETPTTLTTPTSRDRNLSLHMELSGVDEKGGQEARCLRTAAMIMSGHLRTVIAETVPDDKKLDVMVTVHPTLGGPSQEVLIKDVAGGVKSSKD